MYDTWLFNDVYCMISYIKEAVELRTKHISIQEWYDDKNNHDYCEICNVVENI